MASGSCSPLPVRLELDLIWKRQKLTCAGTIMTVASIAEPRWVSYRPVRTPHNPLEPIFDTNDV
jgi:hypothetical protein